MDRVNAMKGVMCVAAVLMMGAATVCAGGDESREFYGWRVSAGANFAFGMRTKLNLKGGRAIRALSPIPRPESSIGERKELLPRAGGPRVDYSSGAWVNPESGLDPSIGDSWNWRIPDSARAGDHFELGTHEWTEVEGSFSERGDGDRSGADDAFAPGVSLELSRELYRDEERGFGVDVAFGLAWYRRNKAFKSGGTVYSRSMTEERTDYSASATYSPGWLNDPYARPDGGWWGAGATDHGTVMHFSDISVSERSFTSSRSVSDTLRLTGEGDYEEWELSLMARPWYELTDWWRVNATLGVGVSRSEFDFKMNAISGGRSVYAAKHEFSDWDVYALAGLGTTVRVGRFDLSLDFLARCLQDNLRIRCAEARGAVDKANWLVRAAIGFEF